MAQMTFRGRDASLNLSAVTLINAGAGRVARVAVTTAGSTAGSVNDASPVVATGSINLPTNPLAGDTVTIGGTAITFETSGATGNQVNIAATAALTVSALLAFLKASIDANISKASYALDGTTNTKVDIAYKTLGTSGNSFSLASTVTGAVLSGATLSGGSFSTAASNLIASVPNAVGIYEVDFPYQSGLVFTPGTGMVASVSYTGASPVLAPTN